jgi:hypothetical protein
MRLSTSRWTILLAATALTLGLAHGCSQPDNPQMVTAPAYKAEPNPEPPKLKGRKEPYGSNKKYQEAMERQGGR